MIKRIALFLIILTMALCLCLTTIYFVTISALPKNLEPASVTYRQEALELLWIDFGGQHPLEDSSLNVFTFLISHMSRLLPTEEGQKIFHHPDSALVGNAATLVLVRARRDESKAVADELLILENWHFYSFFTAALLAQKWTKSQILNTTLAESYFGHGFYGLDSASQGYFGKEVKDLEVEELAFLISLLQAPSLYDPWCRREKATEKSENLLKQYKTVFNSADIDPARIFMRLSPNTCKKDI